MTRTERAAGNPHTVSSSGVYSGGLLPHRGPLPRLAHLHHSFPAPPHSTAGTSSSEFKPHLIPAFCTWGCCFFLLCYPSQVNANSRRSRQLSRQKIRVNRAVLVKISIAVLEHHVQKQFEKERIYFSSSFPIVVHHWRQSGHGTQAGQDLRAGPEAEAMEECCYGLFFLGSELAPPTIIWDFHQSLIKKRHYRLNLQANLMEAFSQLRVSFFTNDFSLCQIDIKLAKTQVQIVSIRLFKGPRLEVKLWPPPLL